MIDSLLTAKRPSSYLARHSSVAVFLPIILIAGALFVTEARAFSCIEMDEKALDAEVAWTYERADSVFLGRPVNFYSGADPIEVEVLEYWKGTDRATVLFPRGWLRPGDQVIFARRTAVGSWEYWRPYCLHLSPKELSVRLTRLFGSPAKPIPGSRDVENLLFVVPIFLLSGLLAFGVWSSIGRLSPHRRASSTAASSRNLPFTRHSID